MRNTAQYLPKSRRTFLSSTALALAAWGTAGHAKAAEAEPMFMFVHTADAMAADSAQGTLRLIGVSKQTLYFSDRPERIAGHMSLDAYLNEWTEGKDNFGEDPPNATLSVYEKDTAENTLAVIEIFQPVVDGEDLIYSYKLLDGAVPEKGAATALFIDAIGIGGGVGLGYHGVGVGLRGPGVL
ncbi:MAG TPA: hypothetical protein VJL84_07695 [Kiloniellales bacterium]|nr:hypothetical protein [Kiloniellales bacterium]